MSRPSKLRILHLVMEVSEQEFPYNEICLHLVHRHDVSICSVYPPVIDILPQFKLFAGDGTIYGFLRALRKAAHYGLYDVVHAHTPHVAFLSLCPIIPSSLRKVPRLFSVYHSYTNSNLKLRNRLLELPVFTAFDTIVFCSKASRRSFPRLYRRALGGRWRVIGNGVDLRRVDEALSVAPGSDRDECFTVTSIGRLIPIKNPFPLLEAFLEVGDTETRLYFVGGGELYAALLRRGQSGANGRVVLTGVQPRETVYQLLAETDLFVSMSKGEGLPVAALEAMAAGCPVILSDIPAHREIAEGVDFIPLVRPDDVVGLKNQIIRILRMSAEERIALGARGRRLAETQFSLDEMIRKYEEIYWEFR